MATSGRRLSRRMVLRSGVGAAAVLGLAAVLAPAATAATSSAVAEPKIATGRKSANGWDMETGPDIGGAIWTAAVPGSGCSVALRIGAATAVLVHVARRFHYEIGSLDLGGIVSFKDPANLTGYETNHASGTAIDIRPGWYPAGVRGNFLKHEVAVIRDVLRECGGVVGWGGDFAQPDEGHFQIDVGPGDARLARLVDQLRHWDQLPGKGAGAILLGS